MVALWADGWFYISSAGLLVSGILFFFLLGQYRVASEAADVTEGDHGADKEASAPATVRPVYISPDDVSNSRIVSHPIHEQVAKPVPEMKAELKPAVDVEPKPKIESSSAAPERRKDATMTTGGISPAVVYLQNIKGELAELHQEMRALAKRVDEELSSVSAREGALIDRLGELTRAVENFKSSAPVVTDEGPAPKRARKSDRAPKLEAEVVLEALALEPASEPAPVAEAVPEPAPEPAAALEAVPEPAPEPAPRAETPAFLPDETMRVDLSSIAPAPSDNPEPSSQVVEPAERVPAQVAPEPAPVLSEPPPNEKPRRGPVWPV